MSPFYPGKHSAQLSIDLDRSVIRTHDALQQVDGQREDNGGVFLRSDRGQGLKVAELKGGRRLGDNNGRFFESSGGIHFPFSCNHLRRRKTRSAGKQHGAMQWSSSKRAYGTCQESINPYTLSYQILFFPETELCKNVSGSRHSL